MQRRPQSDQSGTQATSPRIAYLLSRYPAISHTFFLKEVLGLRQRGIEIHVASINAPDRPRQDLPSVEAAEAAGTFYVKSGGPVAMVLRLLSVVLRHPLVTLRGLAAALALGGLDIKARGFALFYCAEALLVGNWMRRNALYRLHVHFGGPVATVGMLTAQAWQIPWSITFHGPDEFFDQDHFYLAQKISSARRVLCISDFCLSQVLRIVPQLTEDRHAVIRLGVDCTALQPAQRPAFVKPSPASPDSPATPVRLVCTGRMVTAKGHRILLEALAQCLPALAADGIQLTCTLIGDGPERPALEALCRRTGIAASIRFLGAQGHAQTLAEVAQADVFVLASFAEGLPVALMEAMALGVPCVSTTIAAIPELIQNGENGLLVPPANIPALAHALTVLARDPALRRTLGHAARTTAETDYNLARNLDTLAADWRTTCSVKE